MRPGLTSLYMAGTVVLLCGLLGGRSSSAKVALAVGGAAVLAAGIANCVLRKRETPPYTTTDWLRRRPDPARKRPQGWYFLIAAVLWLAAILFLDTPYTRVQYYLRAAVLLTYVAAVGSQIFAKQPPSPELGGSSPCG